MGNSCCTDAHEDLPIDRCRAFQILRENWSDKVEHVDARNPAATSSLDKSEDSRFWEEPKASEQFLRSAREATKTPGSPCPGFEEAAVTHDVEPTTPGQTSSEELEPLTRPRRGSEESVASSRVSIPDTTEFERMIRLVSPETVDVCRNLSPEALVELTRFAEDEEDVFRARSLLVEMASCLSRKRISGNTLSALYATPACRHVKSKLKAYQDLGEACCVEHRDWFSAFKDRNGTIHAAVDNDTIRYRCCVNIPAKLTQVMAVANEVQFMRKWNPLLAGDPQVLGLRTACHFILNYCMSALGGLYRVEVLNEIQRFCDAEAGLLAEHVKSLPPDHPNYREPSPGYKPAQTELKNLWVACGDQNTMLIQVGQMQLPFKLTKSIVVRIGQLAGSRLIGGLVQNSLQATLPGNIWESSIRDDVLGFYSRLDCCVQSQASQCRAPTTDAPFVDDLHLRGDLHHLFEKRSFVWQSDGSDAG